MYDFTTLTERRDSLSIKWKGVAEDEIPAFVADSDFRSPPSSIEAMQACLDHGIFGYMADDTEGWNLQIDWWKRYHDLDFTREQACYCSGVVPAQVASILAVTKPGDAVVLQPPIYPPFISAIRNNERTMVNNPLLRTDEGWRMDFDDLEDKFRAGAKVFLLCSPHNPVGRVWTREELQTLADLAARYDVRVISDEIHGDLEIYGHRHVSYASIDRREDRVVTLIAATKTFNLQGLHQSTVICKDPETLKTIRGLIARTGAGGPNIFGQAAQNGAYRGGRAWLEELKTVIEGNIDAVRPVLLEKGLWCAKPEGTYILWVDGSALGLRGQALVDHIRKTTGVLVTNGADFGDDTFFRLILATQPARAASIAERMKRL